jgi:transposase
VSLLGIEDLEGSMPKPCSDDLRKRIVRAVEDGASVREAADIYDVAPSTVVKVHQRWCATGTVKPKPMGGDQRSHRIEAYKDVIMGMIEAKPDLTLEEIRHALAGKGIETSYGALWRFFDRHRVRYKKSHARQRTRAPGRGRRAQALA